MTSAPWDWAPRGSGAAVVRGGCRLRALIGLTLLGVERAQMKEVRPKLCCSYVRVYVSPGGSISSLIREAVLGLLLRLLGSLCCS